jgi:hypothetical protein
VRLKLNTIKSEFAGKNVLLVDDSIVRGTTAREIVDMARECQPKKVSTPMKGSACERGGGGHARGVLLFFVATFLAALPTRPFPTALICHAPFQATRSLLQVFFTSAAPAIKFPNVYGIDIPTRKELVAHNRTVDQVASTLGVDWLIYQDLEDLEESVNIVV